MKPTRPTGTGAYGLLGFPNEVQGRAQYKQPAVEDFRLHLRQHSDLPDLALEEAVTWLRAELANLTSEEYPSVGELFEAMHDAKERMFAIVTRPVRGASLGT